MRQDEPSPTRWQGFCPKCGAVIDTNIQGNEIGEHKCKEKPMSIINAIPEFLKEGVRVRMKKSVPRNLTDDDGVLSITPAPDEYYKGKVLSVNPEYALIMWDGELFPATTSRNFMDKLLPE